jgi:anti-sigma-K factor RskA
MSKTPHVVNELQAYALGIQSEHERKRVEAHVDDCPSCRAELFAWDRLVGGLTAAYTSEQASQDLESKILERFVADRAIVDKAIGGAGIGTGTPKTEGPRKNPRFRRPRALAFGLAAAAIALAVGLGSLFVLGRAGHHDEMALGLEESPRVVELRGGTPTSSSFGMVVFGKHKVTGILVVGALPALGEGRQYQLWLVHEDEIIDGGTFSVGENGNAVHPIEGPYPLESCRSFSVTVEVAGGRRIPSGPTVLSGIVSL